MFFNENEKKRVEIIRLFKEKFSRRKIAEKMNIPVPTVIKVVKNYVDRGITDRKKVPEGEGIWIMLKLA
jgi:DNA invertase Pin-like site-specific DNA recombinase